LPAFAVSNNHVLAADIDEHRWADLAGEGAVVLGVAVLRAERDWRPRHDLSDARQERKRRTDGDGNTRLAAESLDDAGREQLAVDRAGVHFPVAGDEFLAHGFISPCSRLAPAWCHAGVKRKLWNLDLIGNRPIDLRFAPLP